MLRPTFAVRLVCWFLLSGAASLARADRVVVPFNADWRFAMQPNGVGFSEAEFADAGWEAVALPHTWNARDGQDGGGDYRQGDGWYRKTFVSEPAWSGRRVWIEFGAANRVAEVWLNGRKLGKHEGGYARFRFDLTPALKLSGRRNVLAVRVNNETNGLVPLQGDFTFGGGIYREVNLVVVPAAHFALADYGSPGVYLTPDAADGTVRVRVLLENDGVQAAAGQIRTLIRDVDGRMVGQAGSFTAPGPGRSMIEQTITVPQPHLWAGRADPHLYRVTVEWRVGGVVTDSVTQPLGFRTFRLDPLAGAQLNGRPYALHGVNLHQDRLDKGYAVSAADHREDFALLEELGVTAVRLCHYQHDDYVYQLADTDGLVVWAELAFVNHAVSPNPTFADNAVNQLRELIRQNYNHPSILCWSLGNETTNEQQAAADALIVRLQSVARSEDPGRPTAYASHHAEEDPRNFRTDLLGYNRYYGWYTGHFDDFGPWLDAWHAKHPERPLAISEYGAGGSIFQHEPVVIGRTQAAPPSGPWHPEEVQNDYHEHAWLTLQARPWLWASFAWNMFDFASDGRHEGDTPGRNDKGFVTYDRRTRKDVFYWYQANWTVAPMVHLTSRRFTLRTQATTLVKIYSNCDRVELRVNGRSLGERTSPDHRFLWTDVTLQPGANRIEATGRKGAQEVTDACEWTLNEGGAK